MSLKLRSSWIVFGAGIVSLSLLAGIAGMTTRTANSAPAGSSFTAANAVIKTQCVTCHNDKRNHESKSQQLRQKLMKSGEHGPIVIPGHPEQSKLILYVNGTKKPKTPVQACAPHRRSDRHSAVIG